MFLERFTDDKGDLFIKFPLINNFLNDRKWRASPEANAEYVYTAIGKPLTLMVDPTDSIRPGVPYPGDYHPFAKGGSATVPEHVEFAKRYAYGTTVDVTQDSGKYKAASGEIPWFGIGKVEDPVVKEEWLKPASKLIPPGFSPGIIHLEGPDDDISKYEIVHIASVPAGAFGPKFVTIATCQGALNTCAPQLKAASGITYRNAVIATPITPHKSEFVFSIPKTYKEKTGCCPLDAFSSLLTKSASTDHNMSLNASNAMTPGPGTFTSNTPQEIRSGDGNILGQSSTSTQKPKPTLKIKRLGYSTEPSQEEEQEIGNPNNNNNNGEEEQQATNNAGNPDADAMFRKSSYYKELQDLKGKYKQQSEQWAYKEKRNEIEKIIPKRLFTDQKGRFRQKDWENEVERAIKENVPITFLQEYYATKEQLLEVPEIKRASSAYLSTTTGSIPMLKGASSLESDEERIKAEKALRLNGGF